MSKALSLTTFIFLLLSANAAFAMQCEVKFRAQKVSTEKHWFGAVDKIKTKSGITTGEGSSKMKCESNALNKIKKGGWEITYQKIISSK